MGILVGIFDYSLVKVEYVGFSSGEGLMKFGDIWVDSILGYIFGLLLEEGVGCDIFIPGIGVYIWFLCYCGGGWVRFGGF